MGLNMLVPGRWKLPKSRVGGGGGGGGGSVMFYLSMPRRVRAAYKILFYLIFPDCARYHVSVMVCLCCFCG
jgi:hypothetical protein